MTKLEVMINARDSVRKEYLDYKNSLIHCNRNIFIELLYNELNFLKDNINDEQREFIKGLIGTYNMNTRFYSRIPFSDGFYPREYNFHVVNYAIDWCIGLEYCEHGNYTPLEVFSIYWPWESKTPYDDLLKYIIGDLVELKIELKV